MKTLVHLILNYIFSHQPFKKERITIHFQIQGADYEKAGT